jgi:hypothetical protein
MIPEDKDYGSKNPGGTWSGTVGIVATRHAHLGLNMFAFSTERMEVVDFLNHIFIFRKAQSLHAPDVTLIHSCN